MEVADFQITYSNASNGTSGSKKGFPRLVFRENMTKIWAGGRTKAPRDRPECGFNNELCPPPTKEPSGNLINCDGLFRLINHHFLLMLSRYCETDRFLYSSVVSF